jgi:metallo-beta-lactamase family protein
MHLRFLGAAGTVTGSRYLLSEERTRLLVDCGLFQGVKNIRSRNWKAFPVDPASLDAVVLTHAHLDHSGYLPRLMHEGFRGPIHCTEATAELVAILLEDSAGLQEEDARHANRHGYSKHRPAEPLYTVEQAQRVLKQLRTHRFDTPFSVGPLHCRFRPAGHILGAASVRVESAATSITFSGDVGRPQDLVIRPPAPYLPSDYLVLESTYGDRRHAPENAYEKLGAIVRETVARGGSVMIPAFAVGRAQAMTFLLAELKAAGEIPAVPVYLDSPMAIDVAAIFRKHGDQRRLSDEQCERMCAGLHYVRTPQESRALADNPHPKVIIAGAGMLNGGRILHHLKVLGGDYRSSLVITGYQAAGTRGDALLQGTRVLRIHGEDVLIHCHVAQMANLSAHADYEELLQWLDGAPAPRRTFVTHGEPVAADALRQHLQHRLGWAADVPEQGDEVEL